MGQALYQSSISSLPLLARGKVRDIYAVGADKLLLVTTDRLSAFDVILDDPIPGKGAVLNAITQFWLERLAHVVPNHSTNTTPEEVVAPNERDQVVNRAVVVKRLEPILVEAVVRGYLIGSGWSDYQAKGQINGIVLPAGLQQAQELPEPVFAPAAKAEVGEHDENIDFATLERRIGKERAAEIRDVSLRLYGEAARYAQERGIIIADTKFEFGLDRSGRLHLMDELLTPDSSRFWPADQYRPGSSPPSYDKQYVRDWLEQQSWNKTAPAPRLPAEIIGRTAAKYREAFEVLTGHPAPL